MMKRDVLKHVSWMFEYVDLSRSYDIAEEIYEMATSRGNELERLDALNQVICTCVPRGDINRIRSLASESRRLSVSVSHFHYRYIDQGMITALALLETFRPDVILCEAESSPLSYLKAVLFRLRNRDVGLQGSA